MEFRFNKQQTKSLLKNKDAFAFALLTVILDYLPEDEADLANVETEALFLDLEDEFDVKLPEENKTKIEAAITALTTDMFWHRFDVTKSMSLAFANGDIGDLAEDGDEEVNTCQLLWATYEVGLINGLTFEESLNEFTPDVSDSINEVVDNEGEDSESYMPDVDTVEEAVKEPYYYQYISANLLELGSQLLRLSENSSNKKEIYDTVSTMLLSHRLSVEQITEQQ